MSSTNSEKDVETPKKRRSFLKSIFVAGVAATVVGLASALRIFFYAEAPSEGGQTSTAGPSWPRFKLLNVSALELLKPVSFNYPLVNTPNYLVKLGVKAENGIGPDADIVAFSAICQHLGCYYSFEPPGTSPACNAAYTGTAPEGYCCCHGSIYDLTRGAAVVGGPAPRPVPQAMLEYDSKTGDIYVVGMAAPNIYGHGPPGITDPSQVLQYDLQGGALVTESTLFSGSSS